MKAVTSATVWNDAVGKRISITYSEIDEGTGRIIADNKRIDRVVTDESVKSRIDELLAYAGTLI